MRSYEEIAKNAIEIARRERAAQKKRRRIVLSVAVCATLALFAGIASRGWIDGKSGGSVDTLPVHSAGAESSFAEAGSMASATAPAITDAAPPSTFPALWGEETPETTVSSPVGSGVAGEEPVASPPDPPEIKTEAPYGEKSGGAAQPDVSATVQASSSFAAEASDGSGGLSGEAPSGGVYVYTGEQLTNGEGYAYLSQNAPSIFASLQASGVPVRSPRIVPNGYSHIDLGAENTVRRNARDYLVYDGEALIAILTVIKENATLSFFVSFGAPWYPQYASLLNAHKGEALLMLYIGGAEYVMTPQSEVFSPMGIETAPELPGSVRYEAFRCPACEYVP